MIKTENVFEVNEQYLVRKQSKQLFHYSHVICIHLKALNNEKVMNN